MDFVVGSRGITASVAMDDYGNRLDAVETGESGGILPAPPG